VAGEKAVTELDGADAMKVSTRPAAVERGAMMIVGVLKSRWGGMGE